eukprot:gene8753-14777_t
MVFNLSEGFIPSPNFMNSLLPRSQSFIYRLEGAPGMKVQLFFSYMNLGSSQTCTGARLSIYESPTATGVPAQTRCGRNTTSYLSSTNIIALKLENWASLQEAESGFKIFYHIGTRGGLIEVARCAYNMNSSQSEFSSPLYPFNYPKNTKCKYEITVNKGQMIFIDEQYYERVYGNSLKVYEKSEADGAIIETELLRFGGFTYWSIGNRITLVFKSGNETSGKGLRVRYIATNGCNLFSEKTYGNVLSPLFPNKYPNGVTCNYAFGEKTSRRDFRISVRIRGLELESSPSCKDDSLKIYDGGNDTAVLLDNLCGTSRYKTVMSSTGKLYMRFKSNGMNRFKGFQAHFTYTYLTLDYRVPEWKTGTLMSWNHPFNYPHRTSSVKRISTTYGNRIIIIFTHFDFENSTDCTKDSLKIYEGSVTTESLMSTRCGSNGAPYVSNSSNVILQFTSDERISKTGYRANIEG